MKKVLLIFVPGAHPTYMPPGIASLYASLKTNLPLYSIDALDLNIHIWNQILNSSAAASLAPEFFKGKVGNFFDPDLYNAYRNDLSVFYSKFKDLEYDLKQYLKNREASPAVEKYLNDVAVKTALRGDETVALSVMFPDQGIHMMAIAMFLKEHFPQIKIIAGGAAVSFFHIDDLLEAAPFIDAFYRGEGEEGLRDFIAGREYSSIRGLSWRSEEGNFHNPAPAAVPLDQIPIPDFTFTESGLYLNPSPVLPVSFSRGCSWKRCSFCSHNFSFAGYRSLRSSCFADMLEYYCTTMNIRHFYFADQYIGAADLYNISCEIIKRSLTIRFHVMGRPTSDYTPHILETAYKAGCCWISWGVESGSAELLNICSKGTTPPDIAEVLKNSHNCGISNLAMMIFGLPGTDAAKFQETLDFASSVSPYVDAFTSSLFQLFEGTPFYRNRDSLGIIAGENEILLSAGEKPLRTIRREYSAAGEPGQHHIHPGVNEINQWEQWRLWVRGGKTFRETLNSEHYLLYCAHERDSRESSPDTPPNHPVTPDPLLDKTG